MFLWILRFRKNHIFQREIFVGNLTEEIVSCPDDVAQVLIRGERNRHVGVTNMNERSSRSHTIFRMVCEVYIAHSTFNQL